MTSPEAPLVALLEALLLAADHPLTVKSLVDLINTAHDEEEWPEAVKADQVRQGLEALVTAMSAPHRGIELVEVAEGWRLRTRPTLAPLVRRLWPQRPTRLSKAALEALAIIAYRQPCTRADVEAIRGVDCGGVVRSLLDRELLKIIGRKDEPGRPLLYGTSKTFLEVFSLPDLRALPTLRDLKALEEEERARAHGRAPDVEAARAAKVPPSEAEAEADAEEVDETGVDEPEAVTPSVEQADEPEADEEAADLEQGEEPEGSGGSEDSGDGDGNG